MTKQNNNWRVWRKPEISREEGNIHYQRALGKLPEMESAKALSNLLSTVYKPKMTVLDVGCGAGHYLRSLRQRVDKNINYTGLDATPLYIKLAKKAYGDSAKFYLGDILKLPFKDNSFDIVTCNNLIVHLPPSPIKAISELVRVAKKYAVIRTTFGETTYIIKEVRNTGKSGDLFDKNGEPFLYGFYNMYEEKYIRDIISSLDKNLKVKIIKDDQWKPFDNRKLFGKLATAVFQGQQVSGNLLLDWRFILIKKNAKNKNSR